MGICKQCGKEFHKNKAFQKFCSKECRMVYRNSGGEPSGNIEYQCLHCGKTFMGTTRSPHYCSLRCNVRHRTTIINNLELLYPDIYLKLVQMPQGAAPTLKQGRRSLNRLFNDTPGIH